MRQATRRIVGLGLVMAGALASDRAAAQPSLLDPALTVSTGSPPGLALPTGIRFLAPDDFFAIEKNSGKVKRVHAGSVDEVLDLAVANDSERGLLDRESSRTIPPPR